MIARKTSILRMREDASEAEYMLAAKAAFKAHKSAHKVVGWAYGDNDRELFGSYRNKASISVWQQIKEA